ncbi:MAG: hypothetical protein ACFFAL_01325 [Promethearchaeota archaeon]
MSEPEQERVGLSHGTIIFGIITGIIIVLYALSYFIPTLRFIYLIWWPYILLILGTFLIVRILYRIFQSQRTT